MLWHVDAIDEEYAIKMVALVLNRCSEKPGGFKLEVSTKLVLCENHDRRRARHLPKLSWDGETPFFALLHPSSLQDLRVYEDGLLGVCKHEHTKPLTDLRCCKPEPMRLSHGETHVSDETLEPKPEVRNGFGLDAQYRIGVLENGKCHGGLLPGFRGLVYPAYARSTEPDPQFKRTRDPMLKRSLRHRCKRSPHVLLEICYGQLHELPQIFECFGGLRIDCHM